MLDPLLWHKASAVPLLIFVVTMVLHLDIKGNLASLLKLSTPPVVLSPIKWLLKRSKDRGYGIALLFIIQELRLFIYSQVFRLNTYYSKELRLKS